MGPKYRGLRQSLIVNPHRYSSHVVRDKKCGARIDCRVFCISTKRHLHVTSPRAHSKYSSAGKSNPPQTHSSPLSAQSRIQWLVTAQSAAAIPFSQTLLQLLPGRNDEIGVCSCGSRWFSLYLCICIQVCLMSHEEWFIAIRCTSYFSHIYTGAPYLHRQFFGQRELCLLR